MSQGQGRRDKSKSSKTGSQRAKNQANRMRLLAILAVLTAACGKPPAVKTTTPVKLLCKKNIYAYIYAVCRANQWKKKKCRRAAKLGACRRKK